MPGNEHRQVLIAGAGIGGLVAALMLEKSGWQVTLCDREPELHEIGAGVQLSPNASRILIGLGLGPDLAGPATRPEFLQVRRARDSAVLNQTRLGAMAEGRFGAPFLCIHRGDLQRLLLNRVRRAGRIELRLGIALTDMRMGGSRVAGIFSTVQGESRFEADLLIGADGLWSRARALSGLPSPSLISGQSAWRTLIAREGAPLFARDAAVSIWLGRGAHLVHYPVCGGEMINVVAVTDDGFEAEGEGWDLMGEADLIRRRFSGWNSHARDLIHAAQSWRRWGLLDRAPESRWSRGLMTLLGDAAHPMLPFLAQGASQAIEDAAVLDAELLTAHGAPSVAAALLRYDKRRIGRTARIQRLARQQGRIYHLKGVLAEARDTVIRAMPDRMLIDRYHWIYGHDALASTA